MITLKQLTDKGSGKDKPLGYCQGRIADRCMGGGNHRRHRLLVLATGEVGGEIRISRQSAGFVEKHCEKDF